MGAGDLMEPPALPLAGVDSLLGPDLVEPLGGAAALLALLGLLLLLPLFVTQRREIGRLRAWQELEPQAGDPGDAAAPLAAPAAGGSAATATSGGRLRPMTAAERVTSERPALTRIGTAERAALEPQPLWRRVLERGPRHPLVLSLLALLTAGAIFAAAALFLRAGSDEGSGEGTAGRAATEVVVVNASASPGLAGKTADEAERLGYTVAGTTAAGGTSTQSVVQYAEGAKSEATSVARRLEIGVLQPFDTEAEAAANGADVVVIAGEDRAKAPDGRG